MAHKLSEVKIDEKDLLQKNYSAEELVGKTILIKGPIMYNRGQMGEYLSCKIEGKGLDENREFQTGSQNIMVKIRNADDQGLLPLEVKIKKIGNAYDIE